MHELPSQGYLREPQVLKLLPISRSTWWSGIKSGRYPRGHKISARCTAWKVEDVRRLLEAEAA